MEIRSHIKNIIFNALNYSIFRFEDFTIVDDNNFEYILNITYDNYYLEIVFPFESDNCTIRFSPGQILQEDSVTVKISNFERSIGSYIQKWLYRIKEDLLNPLEKRFIENSIQEFKSDIEIKLSEMEDGYFTKEEGDRLKEKLQQIEQMILDENIQNEMQLEISKMQQEIEFLKATVDTLTKKKWLKNMLIKIWVWGQKEENQKLIKSGVDAVKTISQIDVPKI